MSRRRALRLTATTLVVLVVGYFFARGLSENWAAVRSTSISVNGFSVLAVLLFAAAVPVSGLLWGHMLGRLGGSRVSIADAVRVQCASWLLKYVPGQVGSIANKIAWAASRGVSRTLVVITFVYENVFLILGSVVAAGAVLLLSHAFVGLSDDAVSGLVPVALALVPLLLLTNRHVFRWCVNLVARKVLKRDVPAEYFLRSGEAFWYQVAFLVPRVMNGVGFVLVAASFLDVEPGAWVPLAAIYVLAGAAGILAFLVPSGIGVRESVIVVLSVRYVPLEQAIILSLLARLYSTLADALVAMIYGALKLRTSKEGSRA